MTWIQTYTGTNFDLERPMAFDLDELDIAHALSQLCRFNGHCNRFYSVAEHAVLVSEYLRNHGAAPAVQWYGLHHDDVEAYLGDVTSPLKRMPWMREYRDREKALERMIGGYFLIDLSVGALAVRNADRVVLASEREVLFGAPPRPWGLAEEADPVITGLIRGLDPERAFDLWDNRFSELAEQVGFNVNW